jgi:hypothetical protein
VWHLVLRDRLFQNLLRIHDPEHPPRILRR